MPSHAPKPLQVHLRFETNISYPLILGVAQAAYELGWNTNFSQCLCLSSLRAPPNGAVDPDDLNCDGLIIFGSKQTHPTTTFNCPVVTISNCNLSLDQTPSVNWDWADAARRAADYLLSLNYPNLAFWRVGPNLADSQVLEDNFVKTCADQGKTVTVWKMEDLSLKNISAHRKFCLQAIKEQPLPCAILTEDDRWANMLINILREQGKRVPEDFAVMGMENIDLTHTISSVKISTIEMDAKLMGYQAACLLSSYIKNPACPPKSCTIPAGRLIERASTCMIFCKDPKIQEAFLFIRQNFKKPLIAADVADHCGLTPSDLSRKYCAEIGKTPSQDLRDRRLECACSLLEDTELKLESIAVESGLGRLNNLWRLFKNKYDMTPGEWRERRRVNGLF